MMYPFMTLNDETEITHSEILNFGGKEQVKVYIETPICGGFKNVVCWLPDYKWENNNGYSEAELGYYKELVTSAAHVIIRLAKEGGIEGNASNF